MPAAPSANTMPPPQIIRLRPTMSANLPPIVAPAMAPTPEESSIIALCP